MCTFAIINLSTMNKVVLFSLLVAIISLNSSAWNIFVPNGDVYEQIEVPDSVKSINDIGKYLGYDSPKYYVYGGDWKQDNRPIQYVLFKSLSSDILAVLCLDKTTSLTAKDLNVFLKDYDYVDVYSSTSREMDLEKAVQNKSFSKKFICEVLHLPYISYAVKNKITDSKNGYIYTFENGILVSWETSDGLNKWARSFKEKNPAWYDAMCDYARQYWGADNKSAILEEVNTQFDAFANLPDGWHNKYLDLFHLQGEYVYNFAVLAMTLRKYELNLTQFKKLTHDNCILVSTKTTPAGKILKYKYKMLVYLFDGDGDYIGLDEDS